ncbi:MAG TPA: universal stress protein [Phycisphaerales bacterium]|nr:universal stress protein [Phycisphaerales bacterium]
MYKKILVALENSETDKTILVHIAKLAKGLGSTIILIHVADGFAARNQKSLNLAESQEMREDREYLERCKAEMEANGVPAVVELACGDPKSEIVASAEREKCDLIAMATHGHGFVKDVVLGSVAEGVRHRTSIPVLMVRAG